MRDDETGLTTSDNKPISFASAAAAIAKLRDVLGGTSSASVENPITRTATAYTSSVTTADQPDLFAVNSAGVSFVRSPYQVWITQSATAFHQVLCGGTIAEAGVTGTEHCVLFQHYHSRRLFPSWGHRYVFV